MPIYHGWTGIDLLVGPESYDIAIRPAIEWSQTPSGSFRGYDDGVARDTYETTLQVRLDAAPAILLANAAQAGSTAYASALTYTAPPLCRPFGPAIDCSGGVSTRILSVETVGQPDARTQLWDYRITMRLLDKPTPSGGGVSYFLAHGRAFPEADSASIRQRAEGGRVVAMQRPSGPTSCMWSCGGLTTDQAADIQNYLAGTWRNATESWTEPSGQTPFGPNLTGPFDIHCIEYSWVHEYVQSWRIEARFTL